MTEPTAFDTNGKQCPVDFSHFSESFAVDPWQIYRELRSTEPIAWSAHHGGFWVITSHELIEAVTRDHEHFSARYASVPKDLYGDDLVELPPMTLDPPRHTSVRKLLVPGFSAGRVNRHADELRDFCRSLLIGFKAAGACEASRDYAARIPTFMLTKMLGVSPDMEESFTGWIKRIVESGTALDPEDAAEAAGQFTGYIAAQLEQRREEPTDDLISFLLHSEIDGERLSQPDLIGSCFLFIAAGIDTTQSTLGETLLYLAQHEQERKALVNDPTLLDTAVEEFIRFFAPAVIGRVVKKEVTLGGRLLQEGDSVLLAFPSGCRDQAVFADSEQLVLDRPVNNHVAFGTGAHKCLGAPVARLELRIGLEEWLRAIPDFQLADASAVTWATGHVHGPRRIPLQFSA
jgi:cytochrome P450